MNGDCYVNRVLELGTDWKLGLAWPGWWDEMPDRIGDGVAWDLTDCHCMAFIALCRASSTEALLFRGLLGRTLV